MTAFIAPPPRIPWYLRLGLRIAQRRSGRDLLPAQLLAWYPRAAIGSAVLESLVAHRDGRVDARLLQLLRMTVSFTVECPFCIGVNSQGWEAVMTADELAALQSGGEFGGREGVAIAYARLASATPLAVPADFGALLRAEFSEREIVVLASTIAQVNYWARLVQGLGCAGEG